MVFLLFLLLSITSKITTTPANEITDKNFDTIIGTKKYALINFYATWCPFSSHFLPIFKEAAEQVHSKFPDVMMGTVDGSTNLMMMQKYSVTKFPTVVVLINGTNRRKEFHGKRTVQSLVEYVSKLVDFSSKKLTELNLKEVSPMTIVMLYDNIQSLAYTSYMQISREFRDDCFFFHIERSTAIATEFQKFTFIFFPSKDTSAAIFFDNSLELNEKNIREFINNNCLPKVREVTFENVQDITVDAKPLLIFFYNDNSQVAITKFKRVVDAVFDQIKEHVTIVTADGQVFDHALIHIGVNYGDLPVLALDDMRHIYRFGFADDIDSAGLLKFINDFKSGILHRNFHLSNLPPHPEVVHRVKKVDDTLPKIKSNDDKTVSHEEKAVKTSKRKDSVMQKLAIDKKRFTFLHFDDEL